MRLPLNLFLDTNVLVDLLEPRREFLDAIRRIFCMAFYGEARLWASSSCMTDIFFIVSKNSCDEDDDLQRRMLELVQADDASRLCIYGPKEKDVIQALRHHWPDFEDCLVAVCAERVNADYIVTRDEHGFERSSVPAITPAALLAKVEEEAGITYDEIHW